MKRETVRKLAQDLLDDGQLRSGAPEEMVRSLLTEMAALESQNARMRAALEWVRTWTALSVVDAALKESP